MSILILQMADLSIKLLPHTHTHAQVRARLSILSGEWEDLKAREAILRKVCVCGCVGVCVWVCACACV